MLQFYFLSILLNVLAGLVLVYATDFTQQAGGEERADLGENLDPEAVKTDAPTDDEPHTSSHLFKGAFLDDMTFRLVLGIISVLAGLMKLLSPVQDDMKVIGDLVPAFAGLAAGAALLLEYYAVHNSLEAAFPALVQKVFFEGRKYIGVFCIIAGLMHFIFPRVLFL